jgi:Acetyltransferase (GNAT) domain
LIKQIRGDDGVAPTFASGPGADRYRWFLHRLSRKRDLAGLGPLLARSGALEARLAMTKKDVRRAQKLRYRAFFEEGGATPDPTARIIRRDVHFDSVCDHLIVVDKTLRIAAARHGSSASIACCGRTWPSAISASTAPSNSTSLP